jgi:hypothetical protein
MESEPTRSANEVPEHLRANDGITWSVKMADREPPPLFGEDDENPDIFATASQVQKKRTTDTINKESSIWLNVDALVPLASV